MFLGLIKPKLTFVKTRSKVLLYYGSGLIILFILLNVFNRNALHGSITYNALVEGKDSSLTALTKAFIPEKTVIYFDDKKFRMVETGGQEGNILADFQKKEFYLIDTIEKKMIKASCMDLEEIYKDKRMRQFQPYNYEPELKETSEKAIICGFKCVKYEVVKSGFIRPNAQAEVWITKNIILDQMRYDFQTKIKRFDSPLPLSIGVRFGTILKMIVEENGVVVTYKVESINKGKPEKKLLEIPEKKEFKIVEE